MNHAFSSSLHKPNLQKYEKQHGGGAIVNIGSMWAHQAIKATPSSAYSMQKAYYITDKKLGH
ncbi:hypothetical protein OK016_28005 [Vibrio chagasii]|nr:hypothetical protein [Vibrio chagasii]